MTITQSDSPTDPLGRLAGKASHPLLLLGVLTAAFGVLILAWPGKTLLVAGVLFGVYLLISGVLQLASAFGTHLSTALRVLAFISGAISIILGLFCFRDQLESVLLLAIWIGIGWLFRGLGLLLAAFSDPAMPARGWQLVSGVIITVGGAVMIGYPFDTIAVLTLVTGVWLIAIGAVEVIDAFRVRRHLAALTGR